MPSRPPKVPNSLPALRAAILPLTAITLAWFHFSGQIESALQTDQAQALRAYRDESHDRAVLAQQRMNGVFRTLYEHLRTIARLPGIRRVGHAVNDVTFRGGHGLEDDTRATIQEIYNNLATSIDVSEFYIVPLDLDPDANNPATGKPWEPIATFDELILGRIADKPEGHHDEPTENVEEIEIFEYRLMRRQNAWFREHFPDEGRVEGLNYPALTGDEVITCDNRRYSPTAPNDKDRSGVVYSVPFYSDDGRLAGCVSAIVLTHVIRGMLPSTDFVIANPRQQYAAVPYGGGIWNRHETSWKAGQPAEGLLFSECLPLAFTDAWGDWTLWTATSDEVFWNRQDVRAARQAAQAGLISLAIALFGLGLIWFFLHQSRVTARRRNVELEDMVKSRTTELLDMSRRAGMAEVASGLLHNIGNVLTSANVSVRLLAERVQASRIPGLSKAAALFREQGANLPQFLTQDVRGRQLPVYLENLATHLISEQQLVADELNKLGQGVEHMMEILDSQRQIANTPAMIESMSLVRLARSAVTLVESSLIRHGVRIEESLHEDANVYIDHSRALQILVNLLTNAKDACRMAEKPDKLIRVRTRVSGPSATIEIEDSGVGIAPENLTRMFSGRFTTKEKGRGIGLHFSAIAAADMGGKIEARSEGPGRGATFVLTLPTERPAAKTAGGHTL